MKRMFFVAVLLGTFILCGIFAFSFWRLRTKTPQAYFELGKKHFDEGRLSDATIQFLNALKRDGSHRDSRFYLALTYLNEQNLASGVQHLRALLEAFPDDAPANLKLGNIYLGGGASDRRYYEQAKEMGQKILDKDRENVSALILVGNAFAGLQEYSASVESLERALALDPKNVPAWISLGSTRAREKNFSEAEKAFLKAQASDPQDRSAIISLANFYRVSGSPEKAAAVFNNALSKSPADREIYLQAIDFYLSSGRSGDVERILRAAQTASASDPTPTLDLAEFYQVRNRRDEARSLLLEANQKYPDSVPVGIRLAANLMPDKRDEAKRELDRIVKKEPANPAGQALLAEYQYNSGQFDDAERTLSKQIGSTIPQVHYLLGNLALRKGNTAEAENYFRRSIQLDRRFIPGRMAILNGLVLQNRLNEARIEVTEILRLDPGNMPARLIKASLDMADKKYLAAEEGLNELVIEFPDNFAIHRQLGLYYASRVRNADAEKSLLRALELAKSEQTFQDLTQFYMQTKQADRAFQKLNTVPDPEKQAFHYELMGMLSEQQGKFQDSEAQYKRALEKDPNRLGTEMRLFRLYLRSGRTDEAAKRLDDLAKKSPSTSAVYAMKGTIQHGRNDLHGAEANYKEALRLEPESELAANNYAYLLSHEGRDLEAALQMAQGVRRRQPESADIADTLGWIYYRLDHLSLAKSQAEFAVSKQPGNGEFQYHLGEIYRKNSEKSKAIAALKKAVSSSRDFSEKKPPSRLWRNFRNNWLR